MSLEMSLCGMLWCLMKIQCGLSTASHFYRCISRMESNHNTIIIVVVPMIQFNIIYYIKFKIKSSPIFCCCQICCWKAVVFKWYEEKIKMVLSVLKYFSFKSISCNLMQCCVVTLAYEFYTQFPSFRKIINKKECP